MRNAEVPGSVRGLHLVVPDIEAAHTELARHGMEVSEIFHIEAAQQLPGADLTHSDYNWFLSFSDFRAPTAPTGWSRRSGGTAADRRRPAGVTLGS
jgi:hypothetical protein